ncbi:MAG: TraR/DksA family transcriptional regulator [Bryobacterales bacterium]
MSSRERDRIRLALEAERDLLRHGVPTGERFEGEQAADPVDQAQSLTAAEVTVSVLNNEHRKKLAIENALESIDRGEYGTCQDCGEEISPKRLLAVPWAARCVTCQNESDLDAQGDGSPAYPLAS